MIGRRVLDVEASTERPDETGVAVGFGCSEPDRFPSVNALYSLQRPEMFRTSSMSVERCGLEGTYSSVQSEAST